MEKTRKHAIQERQNCVDLYKPGNGSQTTAAKLILPVFTVRAIIDIRNNSNWKKNKAGEELKCVLPPHTARRKLKEIKKKIKHFNLWF